ncbi:hypothetical protein EXIGLDRAFT_140817 [Exidia glandulosa HHB12029]|uniref:Secreted protein n=1 Tax=Exidia glandulosa HHB12029 TaxID=1314781 RepID=A0A165FW73_EXIGL|nr:hypothetical protein EXIGLDRAFT_140817 [Exidia glandulosa HHB12029]
MPALRPHGCIFLFLVMINTPAAGSDCVWRRFDSPRVSGHYFVLGQDDAVRSRHHTAFPPATATVPGKLALNTQPLQLRRPGCNLVPGTLQLRDATRKKRCQRTHRSPAQHSTSLRATHTKRRIHPQ